MTVRVDAWLWSVRIFKTRSDATLACNGHHVRVNDKIVKPSKKLVPGDHVVVKLPRRIHILEVVNLPKKRVGAAVAAKAFVDHSPPPEPRALRPTRQAVREPGTGRPTKRERRQLDKFRDQL